MWLKTYKGTLVNLNLVESVTASGKIVQANGPSYCASGVDGSPDFTTYALFAAESAEQTEKFLDWLFEALGDGTKILNVADYEEE